MYPFFCIGRFHSLCAHEPKWLSLSATALSDREAPEILIETAQGTRLFSLFLLVSLPPLSLSLAFIPQSAACPTLCTDVLMTAAQHLTSVVEVKDMGYKAHTATCRTATLFLSLSVSCYQSLPSHL